MLIPLLFLGSVSAFSPYPQDYPYPIQYGPIVRSDPVAVDPANARWLINFGVFQMAKADFVTKAAAAPEVAHTVTGVARFYQNPFTGHSSKYSLEFPANKLTAKTKYWVGLQTDCKTATTMTLIKELTAPSFQPLGFKERGYLTTHNIDGTATKIKLGTFFVAVRTTSLTGPVVGCTKAVIV